MRIALKIGNCSGLDANIPLPADLEYFLLSIQERWQKDPLFCPKTDIPLGSFDTSGGHGPDNPGLIFLQGLGQDYSKESGPKVEVRTSFGTIKPWEYKPDFDLWDGLGFQRLHLSMTGTRRIFTQEYFEDRLSKKGETIALDTCNETVHLSLRWLNGEFDDWNNSTHRIDRVRTSYLERSTPNDGGSIIPTNEAIKIIQKAGTKKFMTLGLIPEGRVYGDTGFTPAEKYHDAPNLGYKAVLGFLSRFGSVNIEDAGKIPQMGYRAGIDYLLTKVLPAIEAFAKT